jgi:ABC-type Mn2+/Zn2+ transport system permease subunit
MGTLVSALGVVLSVKMDTPTGATIVCTFGGVLVLMFLVHLLIYHKKNAQKQLRGAGGGAGPT